ncbi:hypothetical protein J6590_019502 [Homalodisca vitripennis]|nr:hypothetical protein J6590_019502 [Homalodisca vitripennis]
MRGSGGDVSPLLVKCITSRALINDRIGQLRKWLLLGWMTTKQSWWFGSPLSPRRAAIDGIPASIFHRLSREFHYKQFCRSKDTTARQTTSACSLIKTKNTTELRVVADCNGIPQREPLGKGCYSISPLTPFHPNHPPYTPRISLSTSALGAKLQSEETDDLETTCGTIGTYIHNSYLRDIHTPAELRITGGRATLPALTKRSLSAVCKYVNATSYVLEVTLEMKSRGLNLLLRLRTDESPRAQSSTMSKN